MTSDTPATPPEVAKHATEKARLAPLALIGLFGSDTAPGALIRLPDLSFQRLSVGDKVASETVEAISADTLILARGARTRALHLPNT